MVSDALDLKPSVFTWGSPKKIAAFLKYAADNNQRKTEPYQTALSLLNFYINRAGTASPRNRKIVLEQAKFELRKMFDR